MTDLRPVTSEELKEIKSMARNLSPLMQRLCYTIEIERERIAKLYERIRSLEGQNDDR